MEMPALENWTPLQGVNGKKVYCRLDDVVFIEETDISNQNVTTLHNRWGMRYTVEHDVEFIMKLLEKDRKAQIEENLKFWAERSKIRKDEKVKLDKLKQSLDEKGL